MPISSPPTFNPAFYNIPLGVAGTVLTSNGATNAPTFQPGVAGNPAAPVNSVQFNSAGVFGGSSTLLYDAANRILNIGNSVSGTIVPAQGAAVSTGATLFLRGGPGGATSGNGQAVQIIGGTTTDGVGGGINIAASPGATTTATNRAGGIVQIVSGAGTLGGAGGNVTITSGAGGATGNGGNMTVTSGAGGATSGNSGTYSLKSGAVTNGTSGAFTIGSGNAVTGTAGNITIQRGSQSAAAAFNQGIFFQNFNGIDCVVFDSLNNFVFDPQPAFNAASNDGFIWIPQAAGVPTGVPTAYNSDYQNSCPVYINKTAMRMYLYDFAAVGWVPYSPVRATAMVSSPVALNDGAGAALGTLANAPVAGNPTKWIPIDDNGTTRFIPAW